MTRSEVKELVDRSDPTILDVGCNDGEHTQMFRELFPDALIYSFEPDARAQRRFKVRNPSEVLVPAAVGASEGVTEFYASHGSITPVDWDLSGSIRRPKNHLVTHPWCTFDGPTLVPIVTLDAWARRESVGAVDFIWADVQGAEGDLVAGGLGVLARTRFFYVEYNDGELYEGQPTLGALRAMLPGFETVRVYENDVLLRNVVI